MSEGKNTQIAAVETGFTALANNNILEEALADEYAGLEFSIDRVKLPAGGGTAFEVPAEDGEDTEMVKDITGVILYNHPAYAYYASAFAGGHAAPDCSSIDGATGIGTPGGDCRRCPFNKFGSGDGQSKLCKNKRMLYILREGELFPVALSLPTGSLKTFTNYVKHQLTKGKKLSQIVTRISLKKATSSAGIAYSQAVFNFERVLSPDLRGRTFCIRPLVHASRKTGGQTQKDRLNDIPGYQLKVVNDAGVELPSTGGPGTRLFTILGSIMILGAGWLIWRRRRLI